MDGVVFFGCILAGETEDYFGTAWVRGEEGGYVVDGAVENYPAGIGGRVFGDCGSVSTSFGNGRVVQ